MTSDTSETSEFLNKLRTTSSIKRSENEEISAKMLAEKKQNEELRISQVRDKLFTSLTEKYHDTIKRGIINSARKGENTKYINFSREDFKANCKGAGYPHQIKIDWLTELSNPESKYLPCATETNDWWTSGEKIHFQGIKFDVWNNKAFTVKFSW